MRSWVVPLVSAAVLAAIHAALAGTGRLPDAWVHRFGADAASTLERPWAHVTAVFLHRSWGHLAYNVVLLMAAGS